MDDLSKQVDKKLLLPHLFEEVKFHPIPLPDPPPFKLIELAQRYGAKQVKGKAAQASATQLKTLV